MDKEKKKKLTPKQKQEKFCQLYASKEEFFGNGVQSYMEAFKEKGKTMNYHSARVHASRLLTNDNILARIDELLEEERLNDSFVDKRLGFWITQMAHPSSAIEAIKEYNKIKRNGKHKENVFKDLTDEELDDYCDIAIEELAKERAEELLEERDGRKRKKTGK